MEKFQIEEVKKRKMMTKMVSVDLDRASPVLLLRAYLCAKRMFPDVPLEVLVSPSGVGFHLKIHTKVSIEENLKIRALLWDEPYRLYYALKKWALNPQEEYIDLVFDEKNDGKEKCIDLEAMLKPYEKEVEEINKLVKEGKTEEAELIVQTVAKKIEPELSKYKKRQWVCCIIFRGDGLRDKLEEICGDIAAKDSTWSYRMYPWWAPEFDWCLALFTDDKDKGWKRLVWLKNKTPLKDTETRMWCKEKTST